MYGATREVSFTGHSGTDLSVTEVSWCRCDDCGNQAELPAAEIVGVAVSCPDCPGTLVIEWTWDVRVTPQRQRRHSGIAA
ncbi:hypothetical protein [Pseudonocardia phyllosphaerae]|uniref:hypothetical protein n=1 Tax=Pseudonocardia phyllosphaerae TaxID=3390502 RepID=UPI00397B5B9C